MAFPRMRGGDPPAFPQNYSSLSLFPACAGVILGAADLPVLVPVDRARRNELFPACAGVIPHASGFLAGKLSFPRMRGGDPTWLQIVRLADGFSPHARG